MKFPQFLVISDTPANTDKLGICKAILKGPQYFEIGGAYPIIDTARRACMGMAKITELHIGAKYTVAFYQSHFVPNPKPIYKTYEQVMNLASAQFSDGIPRRAPESRIEGASTMDPALAMSMGMGSTTPREMAGEEDGGMSFEDVMRLSGHSHPDDGWY